MEWIDVKDRMPDTNEDVLICELGADSKRDLFTGRFNGKDWVANINNVYVSCTAYCYGGYPESDVDVEIKYWMPLPNPPSI